MLALQELDRRVTLKDQMTGERPGAVTLINLFTVAPAEAGALLATWAGDAAFMKAQPGFRSTQLYRGLAGSGAFLNLAVWEEVAAFRAAFFQPAFRERLAAYPASAIARPHLFAKVGVPGICAGD